MAENSGQEKTEDPTARRLNEARQDGNVARSPDLSAAAILLGAILLIYLLGMQVLGGMKLSLETYLTAAHTTNPTRAQDLIATLRYAITMIVDSAVPTLLGVLGVGLLVSVAQVGFLLTGKPLVPKFSKLSPLKGIKNMFGARAGVRMIMSLSKVVLIAALASGLMYMDRDALVGIGELELGQAFSASGHLVFMLAIKLTVVLLVLALLDYLYQRWQHVQDLKMTKQEVKEEMKSMEGDPLVKQRRARVARQLAMQRMAQAVPTADVIVTNPTHLAVALKYDPQTMRAPVVVAKGGDYMAMRIRQIASLHEIPIVERKPLARALYAAIDVGGAVPTEHYAAVAEILAYVYRLSKKSA